MRHTGGVYKNMFGNNINKKRHLVYRFVTYHSTGGTYTTGSGFFINAKHFLTCFHVAFGAELRKIRNLPEFQRITGNNEHSKLENFYQTRISKAEVELPDNSRHKVELQSFDEEHDIALFKLPAKLKIKISKIDWRTSVNYGDRVFFGGFPTHHDYQPDKAPFAVHEGIVSAFVDTTIGGGKYQHIQINSINLGGNSGAPLFRNRGTTVIGIINGNMNWGRDDIIVQDLNSRYIKDSLRTPLSIAYATPLKLLKDFICKTVAV